jgi:hypothetical protein
MLNGRDRASQILITPKTWAAADVAFRTENKVRGADAASVG